MPEGRPIRETFPLNILLEGKTVLVVGGGRVGQRKVELLIDAGTGVKLVCLDCVAELQALATEGRIAWHQRPFESADVKGTTLVFACTDDKHVNRDILAAAREAGVPCCCADGNWADGDFTTPAVLRTGGLLISISTSGRSCRQAKLVKENLKRHLDAIETTDLLIFGTSHEQLSLRDREPFHLTFPKRRELGEMLRHIWGIHEFLILNTCNRVEVLMAVSKDAAIGDILRHLMRFDGRAPEHYYMHCGFDAFAHACEVAAGMRSQIPGEVHIVAQLKEAIEEASAFGWSGALMREWCDVSLRVSKAIRQETEKLLEVSEIEDCTCRWLAAHHPKLAEAPIMIIGTGAVGRGLIERLSPQHKCVWIWHKNRPAEIPDSVELVQLEELPNALKQVQCVIGAAAVTEPLIANAPEGLLLIDLGVPPNISPALAPVDLDTLKNWSRREAGVLELAWTKCRAVIDANHDAYERLRMSVQGG